MLEELMALLEDAPTLKLASALLDGEQRLGGMSGCSKG